MRAGLAGALLAVFAAGVGPCDSGSAPATVDAPPGADAAVPDAPAPDAGTFTASCTVVPAAADALLWAGKQPNGSAILPGGRLVTPAGDQITVGGFPMALRLLPGGRHLVVTDGSTNDEYLSVLDLPSKTVVQREPFPAATNQAIFYGLAVRADGHLFVSGGGSSNLIEYAYDANATTPLTRVDTMTLEKAAYVGGIAFIDDHRLLAADQGNDEIVLYDTTAAGEIGRLKVTGYPYDFAVDATRNLAYVSGWGFDSILVLQLGDDVPTLAGKIAVGKNPEGLLLWPAEAPTKLLVTVADDDVVAVLDLEKQSVDTMLDVRPSARPGVHGVIPNALTVVGDRLFVAGAGDDALDVFATGSWSHLGRIPTGWYPTSAVAAGAGLAVANAKGEGVSPGKGGDSDLVQGTVSLIALEADDALTAGATQVEANNLRAQMLGPSLDCPAGGAKLFPLPPEPGLRTPIEHVVFIVRENKTYDANLGDLAGARGEPSMAMWGEEFTPNLHALARQFVNGDNFYSNAEASIQGHQWTTAGTVNDFIEKGWLTMWGRGTRSVLANGDRVSAPENAYYFQVLGRAKIPYIDYGEIVGLGGGAPGDPAGKFDPSWPGGIYFNLDSKDVDKAKYFADQVSKYLILPRFNYVLLPNNHTAGTTPGSWTPEFMVADNDEATGRIVDAVSHSPFWPTTIVFIIEDDPSDGYDHLEAHRSTLVVVGPWVKHGYVSDVHYDVPALWRTMELLLGLPPQSQQTATAPPMFDLFATTPDLTPFTFIPANIAEERNPPAAKPEAKPMDFSAVDRAQGLGKLLWERRMHRPPPYSLPGDPTDADDDDD